MLKSWGGFEVELTYKRMRSVTLRVKSDGRVVMSAPIGFSEQRLEQLVIARREWIERGLARVNEKRLVFCEGAAVCIFGRNVTLVRVDRSAMPERWRLSEGSLEIRSAPSAFEKNVWSALSELALERGKAELDRLSALTGFKYCGVSVKKMRSKWGYCRIAEKQIVLSSLLALKPIECIEYVALHELAHTKVPAHDKRFYSIIERYMPDYKQRIRLLRA